MRNLLSCVLVLVSSCSTYTTPSMIARVGIDGDSEFLACAPVAGSHCALCLGATASRGWAMGVRLFAVGQQAGVVGDAGVLYSGDDPGYAAARVSVGYAVPINTTSHFAFGVSYTETAVGVHAGPMFEIGVMY